MGGVTDAACRAPAEGAPAAQRRADLPEGQILGTAELLIANHIQHFFSFPPKSFYIGNYQVQERISSYFSITYNPVKYG
jgi:hypothetical protein